MQSIFNTQPWDSVEMGGQSQPCLELCSSDTPHIRNISQNLPKSLISLEFTELSAL